MTKSPESVADFARNQQVTAIEPYRLAFVDKARALLDGQTGVTIAENKVILETDDLYVGRATLPCPAAGGGTGSGHRRRADASRAALGAAG